MFAGVRCRGRERAAGQSSARSGPAEFVEALVVDSEVVGDFVDHGDADFFDDVFFGFADREDFPPVDEDLVWQHSAVAVAPFGERHSFVQAKQPGFRGVFGQGDDHVVHVRGQFGWNGVEGVGDELFEAAAGGFDHVSYCAPRG